MGIVLGALVVPRVASAAASFVTIQGPGGGNTATVTKPHQLEVAEAPPSQFREFTNVSTDSACHLLATIPGNKGFVARSATLVVLTAASTGFPIAEVFPNGSCAGSDVASTTTGNTGNRTMTLEPGFAIAPGGHMSMKLGTTGAVVAAYLFGYLVPAGDVPATTPIGS